MIYLDLPTINASGTTEQQLAEIRSYIYKSNEQMNATLSNLTVDKIWEETASSIAAANSEEEKPKIISQYQKLRDLVIKTADVIAQSDERIERALNGTYLAKSQFGEYLLNTSVEIEESSVGITELYNYSARLDGSFTSYKQDVENYIKRGLLDDTGGTPIYGIEIGLLSDSFTEVNEQGEEVTLFEQDTYFRTRITPDKWSFYQGIGNAQHEVAYITGNAIHFPYADITGGTISIGVNNGDPVFNVDSNGNMTATSGLFSGTLTANNVTTAWNEKSNSRIVLEKPANGNAALNIYDYNTYSNTIEKDFSLDPTSITFFKRDNTDKEMAKLMRERYNSSHWGMVFELKEGFGDYFRLTSNTKTAITYIPPGMNQAQAANNIYSGGEGLYINAPLYVHNQSNGALRSAVSAKTILIQNASDGGPSGTLTMDVVNGVITKLTIA